MQALRNQQRANLPTRSSRSVNVKVAAVKGNRIQNVLSATTLATLAAATPARAEEPVVDSAVDTVIGAVKATGEVVKGTITTLEAGIQALKEGYQAAAPVLEQAYKTASPVVEQVVKVTGDVATPVVRAALPAIKDATKALDTEVVSSATSLVSSTVSTAATTATPFVNKFLEFVATTDPVLLAEYGVGAVAILYLSPRVLGLVGGSFRGFAGEIAPAAALDSIVNEGNAVLVDIRTSKEKETSGIPDLPSAAGGKSLEVEYAITEDKKLRGQLRDPSAIEAQITALQVAALKKISKGTKLILLDRYGPASRSVAKELSRKGYGKVYVISGGFDGRGGWVQSKLQIKPAAILTSSAPPSLARTVFSRGRALPAPRSS